VGFWREVGRQLSNPISDTIRALRNRFEYGYAVSRKPFQCCSYSVEIN
jgi:hypothetical protein